MSGNPARSFIRATVAGCTALLALGVSQLLFGSDTVHAQSYQQSGDVPDSQYLSIDSGAARALKRSDTNAYDVEVWDLSAKKILSSIKGLSGVVNTANISPDGRKVATAERRGIVGVWDAGTGKQIRLLRGHEDNVQASIHVGPEDAGAFDTFARFSKDGKSIVVSDPEGAPTKTIPVELPSE